MTTAPAQKTGYHHGDLRQQLIAATRLLVEEKGPDGVSVSQACRAAGVSTAAPYKHFADRADLMREVACTGFDEMRESFEAARDAHPPASVEAIAAIGTAYVAYAEANPGLFRMMFASVEKTDKMEERGWGCYGVVLNEVARFLGHADVDEVVERTTFPLWAFVHGIAFLRIDGKAEDEKLGVPVGDIVLGATRRLLAGGG